MGLGSLRSRIEKLEGRQGQPKYLDPVFRDANGNKRRCNPDDDEIATLEYRDGAVGNGIIVTREEDETLRDFEKRAQKVVRSKLDEPVHFILGWMSDLV